MEQSVTINNDVCRCCATQGTFKNIRSQYQWMGEEEIYADMIRECFNITLCLSESCLEEGICEVCITQLRNASNFKRQVLQTEEQFKRKIEGVITEVKLEDESQPDGKFIDSDTELHEAFGDDFLEDDYPLSTIKEESKPKLETKAKKRSAKTVKTKTKKTKTEEGETSTKREEEDTKIEVEISSFEIEEALDKIKKKVKVKSQKKTLAQIKEKQLEKTLARGKEVGKHRWNIQMLLQYTNASPIRHCRGIGYACVFCDDQFPLASDLKLHTHQCHEKEKCLFMNQKTLHSFIVKLDVTDLRCELCGLYIENIDEIIYHLKEVHAKMMFIGFSNYFVPFRFDDSSIIKCIMCSTEFDTFKAIQEHMNDHLRNHVCVECNAGYVNLQFLNAHMEGHKKGDFTCAYCNKKFDNERKHYMHVNAVHTFSQRLYKCGYCGEKFKYHEKKLDHQIKVHGATPLIWKCKACDKEFGYRSSLRNHEKRVHLMEKRHTCEICGRMFYHSTDYKGHLARHKMEQKFECDICGGKFNNKRQIWDHIRKAHLCRRGATCEFCGKYFKQKAKWRRHMKVHGIIMTVGKPPELIGNQPPLL